MAVEKKERSCFVIAPIGTEDSDARHRSNQVLKHILRPVIETAKGYSLTRADNISEPGLITAQIIEKLLTTELVVADMTDHNANVFYELAIRHAIRKPVILLIQTGQPIPFDVAATRTIVFDYRDLDSVEYCKDELAKQVEYVEKHPKDVESPISATVDLRALRASTSDADKTSAAIMGQLLDISRRLNALEARVPYPGITTFTGLPDLTRFISRASAVTPGSLSPLVGTPFFGIDAEEGGKEEDRQ